MKHYHNILNLIYDDLESSIWRVKTYMFRINNSSTIIKILLNFIDNGNYLLIINRIDNGYSSKKYEFEILIDSVIKQKNRNKSLDKILCY